MVIARQDSGVARVPAAAARPTDPLASDAGGDPGATSDEVLLDEIVIEDIVIDGMCGVY